MAPHAQVSNGDIDHLPLTKTNGANGTFNLGDIKMEDNEKTQKVLATFRCLIADLCHQFGCGHPGSAMGMAAIGVALWKYVMKYSPSNPDFFNRDRFVLSNGHACLFQYTFLHLVGYKMFSWEQLLSYHSHRFDSVCPGHPEIEADGVEVTTGPLGQGIANSVGLAMAAKSLGATYNREGFPVTDNMTWCMIGDACLQEGVGMEAFQLAAHWRLDNLCVMFDRNEITCDGSVDVASSDDINAKMRAVGWNVIEIEDGNHDVEGIVKALVAARAYKGKPTFINIRTVIGVGSQKSGTADVHGADLGKKDVAYLKTANGMDPEKTFVVDDDVYDYFRESIPRGQQLEKDWNDLVDRYTKEHPDLAAEYKQRVSGEFPADWTKLVPKPEDFPTEATPSRKAAGQVINPIAEKCCNLMVGTADLTPSVNMAWKGKVDFQNPELQTACGINGRYDGRYIHWGIREHAMASASNGMAAYNKGTFLPITSSFFMFYIYAAPGVRMGALQGLQTIHIATHDSIGTGEDGPTHQPIELATLYRAMPNFHYIRPADGEEVAGAVIAAVNAKNTPSMISVSRQKVPQYPKHSSREGVQKGGYVFIEEQDADVTLVGAGAELRFSVETRDVLAKQGIKARVVSLPCWRIFDAQPKEYKRQVLGLATRVAIEAYSPTGWERYADAGYNMHTFGQSLVGKDVYDRFNYDAEIIAKRVSGLLDEVKKDGIEILRGNFRDLNEYEHDIQFKAFHDKSYLKQ
ncbi:Dihydroxyacetone synthase [Fulvia fulva]|uniref:transketolase n=1 Tax=Passalora fulva TaxID=5499 RepID=A0A9Q8LDA3_PASFU|nr:Dihydroxyacetone synthase [Fulvia fulva]KAK4628829.1 Dihydroxyacetone synthase [Fulvia fulva]KAK4630042.1 Dihydroxyacetone synthase [Fulvia fulva]UJO15303.1 Dihydroxyacetone synthase [Fulvia fulva]WPV12916.1 Dihydroxyacetone synthase [Fulvia fulva]WPV27792.1 Dihydroxyacetone synthase [Fulvia fulva]